LGGADGDKAKERFVQFLGIARVRAGFVDDPLDGIGVQGAEIAGVFGQGAAQGDSAGAALLEGGVVEVGVGLRVEHFVSEGRRLRRVLGVEADLAGFDAVQDFLQAVDVHRFVHAVVDGLADQRVIWSLDGTGLVLLAANELRKDCRHQVVGAHALDLRRDPSSVSKTQERQGPRGIPAPPAREHGRSQYSLGQHFTNMVRPEKLKDRLEWKTVPLSQRQHQSFISRCGLQLEVEVQTEAFAKGQSPGPSQAAAKRGMQDELHAAGFVKKSLGDDRLLSGRRPKQCPASKHIGHNLFSATPVQTAVSL
jgi:hypothetical protein